MKTDKSKYRKVTIVGVGLMGGSLGLALKARGMAGEVIGWGRDQDRLAAAVERGAIDRGTRDRTEALAGADLLVFATPGSVALRLAAEWFPDLPPGCLITDLVSVKGKLVKTLTGMTPPRRSYVSSHPLCGSDQTGVAAARADLYRDHLCLVTPVPTTKKTALGDIQKLWLALGMKVVSVPPALHDRIVAVVSHLPHLIAAAAVNEIGDKKLLQYCGTGLRDFTRIAASDPGLWTEIALANLENILPELDSLDQHLHRLREMLKRGDPRPLKEWLRRAQHRRLKMAPAAGKKA